MKKNLLLFVVINLCLFYPSDGFTIDPSDAPDSVIIDSIKAFYDGVEFDHKSHVDFSEGNCARCHHNTAGAPMTEERCTRCHKSTVTGGDKISCSDCHPLHPFVAVQVKKMEEEFLLYHIDKPSLKAAYHLNCLMCHKEQGAPTGCSDCHKMTEAGKRFFETGPYAPKPRADQEKGHH
jgi:hypothetical protein